MCLHDPEVASLLRRRQAPRGRYAPNLWSVWVVAPVALVVVGALAFGLYHGVYGLLADAARSQKSGKPVDINDVVKTTVTVLTLVGAVLAGIYAYRKQLLSEGDAHRADASHSPTATQPPPGSSATIRRRSASPASTPLPASLTTGRNSSRSASMCCAPISACPTNPAPRNPGTRKASARCGSPSSVSSGSTSGSRTHPPPGVSSPSTSTAPSSTAETSPAVTSAATPTSAAPRSAAAWSNSATRRSTAASSTSAARRSTAAQSTSTTPR